MNYLAHLYLAGTTDEALVGNLLGDFVRGTIRVDDWPAEIARGIQLHRRIDSFTDSHPLVLQSKQRISPERRRVAGIIVDVCYDHFLARHWERFSDIPLRSFTSRVYQALQKHEALLPERLRRMAPRMAAEDWLHSYRDAETAAFVLERIALRLRAPNALAGSGAELMANYEQLEADFLRFFPSAIDYAAACRLELAAHSQRGLKASSAETT